MSDCMMSKTGAVIKICHWAELTDILNTENIYNAYNKLCHFDIFTGSQGSMRTFSKHYFNCKTVSTRFKNTLQERRLPILKFSQDNPQNIFLSFLTSRNILITLQYSGDILGIFLKHTFVESSLNTLKTLLRDHWNLMKDQHLLL